MMIYPAKMNNFYVILAIWDYYYLKNFPTMVDYMEVILAFSHDLLNTKKNFFISTLLVNNVWKMIFD